MGPYLPRNTVKSVQRFDGRDLGQAAHIAVLGSCKLGNFVATLPLLRLLRRCYPRGADRLLGERGDSRFRTRTLREGPATRLANLLG